MNILDFETLKDEQWTEEQITGFLTENKNGFVLRITVERAHHYSDLAAYYLEAAFIAHKCSEYARKTSYDFNWNIGYHPVADLGLQSTDVDKLGECIYILASALTQENDDEYSDFIDELEAFRLILHEAKLIFPELAEDYLANLVNGEYYEHEGDDEEEEEGTQFLRNEFKMFPERKFGFWKSVSSVENQVFYGSTDTWIIPAQTDFDKVLKDHSGISTIRFEPADLFVMNNISYLIGQGLLIHFSFDLFLKAKACSYTILSRPGVLYQNGWMDSLLTYKERFINEGTGIEGDIYRAGLNLEDALTSPERYEPIPEDNKFFISEFGDQILIRDHGFSYVIWHAAKPQYQELRLLNEKLSLIFHTSASLAGIIADITCPWDQLDDEKFEILCYDILFHNPSYDNATLRKMG